MAEIRLIVGLGNPGFEYAMTRHNAGFWVLDRLSEKLGVDFGQKKFGGLFGQIDYKGKKLILLKPQSYMNRSGQPVATAMGFYKLGLGDLLVVSDDLALDAGRIRIRGKGSFGGQKGLGDIINKVGSNEFCRLRVGIGSSGRVPAESYVLARPNEEQWPLLIDAVDRACEAVLCWVEDGLERAMNRFNDRQRDGDKDSDE